MLVSIQVRFRGWCGVIEARPGEQASRIRRVTAAGPAGRQDAVEVAITPRPQCLGGLWPCWFDARGMCPGPDSIRFRHLRMFCCFGFPLVFSQSVFGVVSPSLAVISFTSVFQRRPICGPSLTGTSDPSPLATRRQVLPQLHLAGCWLLEQPPRVGP